MKSMLSTDEKLMRIKFRSAEIGTTEMSTIYDMVIERLMQYLEYNAVKYDPSIDIANDIILPGITLQHFVFLNVRRTIYNLKKAKSTAILGYIFRNGLYYFVLQQCEVAKYNINSRHQASFGPNALLFEQLCLSSKYKVFNSRCKNNIMYIFRDNILLEVRYNCDGQKPKEEIDAKYYGFTLLNKFSVIFFEKLSSALYLLKTEFKKINT